MDIQPRILRVGQAIKYSGLSRPLFKEHIRPKCGEITIGKQGIGFEKVEIDKALDDYIARYGCAPKEEQETSECKKEKQQDSSSTGTSGISTNGLAESAFARAAKRATNKKHKKS